MAKKLEFLIDAPTQILGNLDGTAEYYRLRGPVDVHSFNEGRGEYWVALWPRPDVPAEETLPHPMEVRLKRSSDGRLVCTGLKIGQLGQREVPVSRLFGEAEITTRQLAAIPLGQILRGLAEQFAAIATVLTSPFSRQLAWGPDEPGTPFTPRLQQHQVPRRRPGRRGHAPEFWERLAEVYRAALLANPQHPHEYIATHFEYPAGRRWWPGADVDDKGRLDAEGSSRKLVARARKRGHIGRAMHGKAGERPDAIAQAYLAATGKELGQPNEEDLAFAAFVVRNWRPGKSSSTLHAEWDAERAELDQRRREEEERVLERIQAEEELPKSHQEDLDEKSFDLASFASKNWCGPSWQPGTSWSKLRARWNAEHPEQRFPAEGDPRANEFAAQARLAWETVTGTSWPDPVRLARLRGAPDAPTERSDGDDT